MLEKMRGTIGLTSIVAILTQCVVVIVFVTRMSSSVDQMRETLTGIRSDFRAMQEELHKLDVRQSRLEEAFKARRDHADTINKYRE